MTSYLATIRIEAFGLAEAKELVARIATYQAEVVSVVQEPLPQLGSDEGGPVQHLVFTNPGQFPPPQDYPLETGPPRYVTEAIEAAKAELRAEMREVANEVAWDAINMHAAARNHR